MNVTEHFVAIASLFFAIFGVLFLFFLHGLQKIKRLKNSGNMVYGKIVDISEKDYSDGSLFSAIIEFVTLEGQTICFTSNEGGPVRPTIGESVVVLYEKRKPDEAIEFDLSSERKATTVVYILGSIVLLLFIAIISKAT